MNKIKVMPKHLSELIAAGEVVERPASIVKELMENAIDANAKNITVEIKNGGGTFIRVTDDGVGIAQEDVKNAFLRHATSKVYTQDDLDKIGTLGFRGEALPSIASVSKLEMLTRTADAVLGTRYVVEGGDEKEFEEAGSSVGTTLIIQKLFYNVPARMKFLKTDITEANAVAGIVDNIALSHPEISVRFIRDEKQRLLTPGNGDLLSTVHAVLKKGVAETLIEVDYQLDGVHVTGFVSKPMHARGSRNMQHFFLNGRFIKTGTGIAALENAYRNAQMVGKFPACVLNIKTPLESVDVNVHPAKIEVRFVNEKPIYQAIYYGVKSSLAEHDTRPEIKFDTATTTKKAEKSGSHTAPKRAENFWQTVQSHKDRDKTKNVPKVADSTARTYGGKEKASTLGDFYRRHDEVEQMKLAPKDVQKQAEKTVQVKKESETAHTDEATNAEENAQQLNFVENADVSIIGEAFQTYILAQVGERILIIDKHAAHERILFEQLKDETEIFSQLLLEPITVSLQKDEYALIIENIEILSKVGFVVEDFGTGTVLVRECPSYLAAEDVDNTIGELAGYLEVNKKALISDKLEWLLDSIACRSAIKAGDSLSEREMLSLVKDLLSDDSIRYCPHGRPVYIEMSRKELEKNFGRI